MRTVARVNEDMPDSYFPREADGKERFGFSYDRIFVPENESSLRWQMAGNTGEYGGEHGDAPEGAMISSLMGAIYLTDEGWRCNEVGTG